MISLSSFIVLSLVVAVIAYIIEVIYWKLYGNWEDITWKNSTDDDKN